ncbi:hypothetical protein D7V91_17060 [bacterium 1xD42-67]|nr:hypothetical protein D7V91_17060 [bacterium 1xD42-67]
MWAFSLYTIVDGIFVARGVGETAMAAVDLSMPFTSLVFAIGVALAAGTSTLISISLGKGDLDRAPDVRAGLPGPHRPVRPALDPSGAAERRREVDPRLLGQDRGRKL